MLSAEEASNQFSGSCSSKGCISPMFAPHAHSDDSDATSTINSSEIASASDPGLLTETAARRSVNLF